jgi:hypothetical protein
MRRLLLPFVIALLTFFGSVVFTQIRESSYPKQTLSPKSLTNRAEADQDWMEIRLTFAEEKYWRCVSPHTLLTAAEAEKQRRECYAKWEKARREILQDNK